MIGTLVAAIRGMSKLQGQVWGGWALFGGSLLTLSTLLVGMPPVLRSIITGAGVIVMVAAIWLVVWSQIGVPDAAGPASRAITPARAVEPGRATPAPAETGPRRAAAPAGLRLSLPGKVTAPRRATT